MDNRLSRLLFCLSLPFGLSTFAEAVLVPNGGFEAVSGIDPKFFSVSGRLLPGKGLVFDGSGAGSNLLPSVQAIPGWSGPGNSGTLFPTNTVATEGQNVAWLGGAGDLRQTLPTTWNGGSVYVLSVDWAPIATQTPGITIGLYSDGQLVAEQVNAGALFTTRFQTLSITNTVGKGSSISGHPIEIRISSKSPSAGALIDNVRLNVEVAEDWTPAPAGMVAWWRGESSTEDVFSRASGTKRGNQSYGPGRVGSAFSFDGLNAGVSLGNPASLALKSFSIEGWVSRASSATPSREGQGFGSILGTGLNGYALVMLSEGNLTFSQVGLTRIDSTIFIRDTNWHHVAVSVGGGVSTFYIDGQPAGGGGYSPDFQFQNEFAIGQLGQNVPYAGYETFWGSIDELSVYNRALSPSEIKGVFSAGGKGKANGVAGVSFTVPTAAGGSPIRQEFTAVWAITNQWDSPAIGLAGSLELPNGIFFSGASASAGQLRREGTRVVWDLGNLPAHGAANASVSLLGASAGSYPLQATFNAAAPFVLQGDLVATQTVVLVNLPLIQVPTDVLAALPRDASTSVEIPVTLDKAGTSAVRLDYATTAGTAVSGIAFVPTSGTLEIPAGVQTGSISVQLLPQSAADPVEYSGSFQVKFSNASRGVLGNSIAQVRIAGDPGVMRVLKGSDGKIQVGFHAIAGRNYELQRSLSLINPDWQFVSEISFSAKDSDTVLVDESSAAGAAVYYRLFIKAR